MRTGHFSQNFASQYPNSPPPILLGLSTISTFIKEHSSYIGLHNVFNPNWRNVYVKKMYIDTCTVFEMLLRDIARIWALSFFLISIFLRRIESMKSFRKGPDE